MGRLVSQLWLMAAGCVVASWAVSAEAQCVHCGKPGKGVPPSYQLMHDTFGDQWGKQDDQRPGQKQVQQPFDVQAPAAEEQKIDPNDPFLTPKYHYSGSSYPYYYGRSYLSYPHYKRWWTPNTEARYDEHQANKPFRPYKWGLFERLQ